MYLAFNENMRRATTEDIESCIRKQVPLSVSQREPVAALRAWLGEGRAVSASAVVQPGRTVEKTTPLEKFEPVRP